MVVLAVTWHFSYFPTGVAVEIRYQRTSPDLAKVHWARQELGAEWKKPMGVFSGSRQFITWGIFDQRCQHSTNFTCPRKIENYGCTFMFKAFPAFVWINSNWLQGKEGKRPILWAGRACLTALIIPAAPASWLGLDNRLEEGLWAKTMKGEKKIGRAQ